MATASSKKGNLLLAMIDVVSRAATQRLVRGAVHEIVQKGQAGDVRADQVQAELIALAPLLRQVSRRSHFLRQLESKRMTRVSRVVSRAS